MIATFALALLSTLPAADEGKKAMDTRCYEMRVYYSPPGKLEELHARFRNHTLKLFEKHGITSVAYWVPVDNKENKLIYILSYPSREARETSWKAFMADPDWQKVWKESEKNGTLVARLEQYFLKATDYSPEIKAAKANDERVFELRTYKAAPGKLKPLHARFRDHTVKLFSKHGMGQFAYWELEPGQTKDKGPQEPDTLIYVLSHKSQEAAKNCFDAFRADPEWTAAKSASEKDGPLLPKPPESVFLKATDYSPTK